MLRRFFLVGLVGIFASQAHANFHLMQIEQVIGGVNGYTSMQAIQLRMRAAGENIVRLSRIRVWDAAGANPVMIIDMTRDVPNGLTGDRVLIVSPNFPPVTNPPLVSDFVMTNLIPQAYLAAGSMTFEQDNGTIYWRLSWGGANYTGPTTGHTDNDIEVGSPADYGPPYAGPLPQDTLQALRFTGTATALSTSNSLDYAVTTGAAVFTNNARNSFTVIDPPMDIDGDGDIDAGDFARCVACLGGPDGATPAGCPAAEFAACDLQDDGFVDFLDVADLVPLISAP
jgi:hypothetical protein